MPNLLTLAIQGGPKSVSIQPPHYHWPHISKEQIDAVTAQLHRSLSERDNSGVIGAFERAFAEFTGRQYAISFASGTSAIHAMCVASDLQPGDEILCPVYTFFATITPFVYEGVHPVFCDCDAQGNISVDELRGRVSERTKAVIVTHMWGVPCDMTAIVAFCKEQKLLLFEDCSHAHFATWGERRVGTFGDMAAYSLNQKVITAGEGGILVTNNEEYRDKALLFGHYNNRCKKEISQAKPYYKFALTGMGLKMRAHPLAMALALNQLMNAKEIEQRRRANLDFLIECAGQYGVFTPITIHADKGKHGLYVLAFTCADSYPSVDRQKLCEILYAEGASEFDIPNSTCPLDEEPLFRQNTLLKQGHAFEEQKNPYYPNARKFYHSLIKLPLWGYEGDEEIVNMYGNTLRKVSQILASEPGMQKE